MEGVLDMFSEELRLLDRNTVKYMVDEMQEQIDKQKTELNKQKLAQEAKDKRIQELEKLLGL